MQRSLKSLAAIGMIAIPTVIAQPVCAGVTMYSESYFNGYSMTNRFSRDFYLSTTEAEWQAQGRAKRIESEVSTTGSIFNSNFARGYLDLDQTAGFGVVRSNAELSGFYLSGASYFSPISSVTNTLAVEGVFRVPRLTVVEIVEGVRYRAVFLSHGFLMLGGAGTDHVAKMAESIQISEVGTTSVVSAEGSITYQKFNEFTPRFEYVADGMYADASRLSRTRSILPGGSIVGPIEVSGYEIGDLQVLEVPMPQMPTGLFAEYNITLRGEYQVTGANSFYAYAQADFTGTGFLGFEKIDALGNQLPLEGASFMGRSVSPLPQVPEPAGAGVILAIAALAMRRSRAGTSAEN